MDKDGVKSYGKKNGCYNNIKFLKTMYCDERKKLLHNVFEDFGDNVRDDNYFKKNKYCYLK